MIHLIALQGTSGKGKSTTLALLFERLKIKYLNAKVVIGRKGPKDFKAIIEINGKKVGIESQGDPNSNLNRGN